MSEEFVLESMEDEVVAEEIEAEAEAQDEGVEIKPAIDRQALRQQLVKDGYTREDAVQVRSGGQLSDEEIESGEWVKLAVVSALCKENGVPVSRLVKATGGDRAMYPALSEHFQVRWHGRTRYLPNSATEQMDFLRNLNPTPRKKAEAEQAEGWSESQLKRKNRAELEGIYQVTFGSLPEKMTKGEMVEAILGSQNAAE